MNLHAEEMTPSFQKSIICEGENICILSERNIKKKHHVSYDTILGMENAFDKNKNVEIKCLSVLAHYLNAGLKRIIHKTIAFPIDLPNTHNVLFISMSLSTLMANRVLLRRISSFHRLILYCFDTWEAQYKDWEEIFRYINPDYIFLAYKASVDYFSKIFSNVFFLPQSMDEAFFFPRKGYKKERLFMQMGRKNQKIHKMILEYLHMKNIADVEENYVYEKEEGRIIYPNTNELAENICKTKYFICAPQSDENSKLTGVVSDVTARFYEAMACKTLIVGFKPNTFNLLFNEESMIEVNADGSNFAEKVDYFESHPDEYNRIVEMNYDLLMKKHRWQNRLETIVNTII